MERGNVGIIAAKDRSEGERDFPIQDFPAESVDGKDDTIESQVDAKSFVSILAVTDMTWQRVN